MESIEKTMVIRDNAFARQFETPVTGGLLSVEYSFQENKIFLTKINSPEGFDNQGLIDGVLKNILELSADKKLRVVPIHPKVASFFKRNPKYKEMLPPGIRI